MKPDASSTDGTSMTHSTRPPAVVTSSVNNLGYRGWNGRQASGWMRWSVITWVGVRRAWNNAWLKRMLFMAWLPAVSFAVGFFLWEQAASDPRWRQPLVGLTSGLPESDTFERLRETVRKGDIPEGRHIVWSWLLLSFFRYPQGALMVMVVGLIAPPLISQDIRSRAFLVYFSRPLIRTEYLIGKMVTLWCYLAAISTVPALCLYVLGVLLSPELSVVRDTWDLPLRVLMASVVLMVPTSLMALAFSSMTQESRFAGAGWFAVWVLGWFTYVTVTAAQMAQSAQMNAWEERKQAQMLQESSWTLLSLYHTLGRVQSWVFGFDSFSDVSMSVLILLAISVVSIAVLYRRISAPMRV